MSNITIQSVLDADYFKIKKYPAEFFDAKPKAYELNRGGGSEDNDLIPLSAKNVHNGAFLFTNVPVNEIEVDGITYETYEELSEVLTPILFSKGGGSGTGGATNVITEDSDTVAFTGNGTAVTPLKAEVKSDGLDYIPLTGTEEGKPVTGDIFFSPILDNSYLATINKGMLIGSFTSNLSDDNLNSTLNTYISEGYSQLVLTASTLNFNTFLNIVSDEVQVNQPAYIQIGSTDIRFKGLIGGGYYGANYTDNTYVQKKYVDDLMDARIPEPPASGTFTLQSVDGVLTWI